MRTPTLFYVLDQIKVRQRDVFIELERKLTLLVDQPGRRAVVQWSDHALHQPRNREDLERNSSHPDLAPS